MRACYCAAEEGRSGRLRDDAVFTGSLWAAIAVRTIESACRTRGALLAARIFPLTEDGPTGSHKSPRQATGLRWALLTVKSVPSESWSIATNAVPAYSSTSPGFVLLITYQWRVAFVAEV